MNSIKDNLSQYSRFNLTYHFKKDNSINKELSEIIGKLNANEFKKFKAKIQPDSFHIEALIPSFQKNLTLDFGKFKIVIQEDSILIGLETGRDDLYNYPFSPSFARLFPMQKERK
ncbi:MAG: hypothetical protein BAJALOKI1v1_1100019 [Promethearchaeota archaeon]|nr:MAG: hypothetical protein BAJALOKI1v1_1100019 [Candidatus Lokiarchaeota archaeon]